MDAMFLIFTQILLLFAKEIEMTIYYPTTSAELQSLINEATPGDVIVLQPKEYIGNFNISNSGVDGQSIILTGTHYSKGDTVITSGTGTAFDIKANFFRIENVHVRNADIAFSIEGHQNALEKIVIREVKEGVVINGNENFLKELDIESNETSITIKEGEKNSLENNTMSSLNISKESCCGTLLFSKIPQGLVNIDGNNYKIDSLVAIGDVNVQGCGNILRASFIYGKANIAECNSRKFVLILGNGEFRL